MLPLSQFLEKGIKILNTKCIYFLSVYLQDGLSARLMGLNSILCIRQQVADSWGRIWSDGEVEGSMRSAKSGYEAISRELKVLTRKQRRKLCRM